MKIRIGLDYSNVRVVSLKMFAIDKIERYFVVVYKFFVRKRFEEMN